MLKPLRAKSVAVLGYLACRSGRLVSKDELREQVWGDSLSRSATGAGLLLISLAPTAPLFPPVTTG